MIPSPAAIAQAFACVTPFMRETPVHAWPLLAQRLGTRVFVKHENHAPTGAFKTRGGFVYLDALRKREPACPGIIAATRGNHGLSLAHAAAHAGLAATIVVPRGNSREKNAALRALGVELVEHGADFQESKEHMLGLAAARGLHAVPSLHPDLVAGVATGWMEFFRAVPDLDVVYVPIGQGSGFCAAVAARAALGVRCRLVGVVSAHAPAYARSFRAGTSVEAPVATRYADGVACRVPEAASLAVVRSHADDVVEVDDDAVAHAMKAYFIDTHNVAEGAAAAPLAAALAARDALRGLRVGLPLTGGNVDHDVFAEVLVRGLPSAVRAA